MNPNEPTQPPGIDEIKALYREAAGEQPPARHDALILAAARNELAAARKAKAGGSRRWRVPVALAATLVLTVALTLRVEREQPVDDAVLPALPAPQAPAEVRKPATESNAPAQSGVEQRQLQPASGDVRETAKARRSQPTAPTESAPSPAPAVPVKAFGQSNVLAEPPAPKLEAPAAERQLQMKAASPPPAAPAEAGKQRYAPSAQDRDATTSQSGVASPAPVRPPVPLAPPVRSSVPLAAPAVAPPPPPPATNAPQRFRANENGAGQLLSKPAPAQAPPSPREWIEAIRALRLAGHNTEADAELRQFRLAYPDFPIPEDISTKPQP